MVKLPCVVVVVVVYVVYVTKYLESTNRSTSVKDSNTGVNRFESKIHILSQTSRLYIDISIRSYTLSDSTSLSLFSYRFLD